MATSSDDGVSDQLDSVAYELEVTRRQIRQLVDLRLHVGLNPLEETQYKRLIDLEIRLLHLRGDLSAEI